MIWPMKKVILSLAVLIAVAVAAGLALVNHSNSHGTESKLTGLTLSKDAADRPILGIVVENSPPARPQSGLSGAGIIFETVTEGGITRYLALYQDDSPAIVGPVRSLRPYFVDWALGYDASVAHVGGSPEALAMAKQLNLKDLNQFKYPDPYFRDNSRPAPHNMYARSQGLRDLERQLGYDHSGFDGYPRKTDSPTASAPVNDIAVNYSGPDYRAEFRYMPATNSYQRYLAGEPQIDQSTGQPLSVKNLVVLKMSGSKVSAVGNGDALVFMDGQVRKATWQKAEHTEPLLITDDQGKQVPLNRGKTWFAVLPKNQSVSY